MLLLNASLALCAWSSPCASSSRPVTKRERVLPRSSSEEEDVSCQFHIRWFSGLLCMLIPKHSSCAGQSLSHDVFTVMQARGGRTPKSSSLISRPMAKLLVVGDSAGTSRERYTVVSASAPPSTPLALARIAASIAATQVRACRQSPALPIRLLRVLLFVRLTREANSCLAWLCFPPCLCARILLQDHSLSSIAS